MAKLLADAGGFDHDSCGDLLAPLQPKPLKVNSFVNCPPTSLLVKVKVCARVLATVRTEMIATTIDFIVKLFVFKVGATTGIQGIAKSSKAVAKSSTC